MSSEALKARLMRQTFYQEVKMLFAVPTRRFTDIHALSLTALLTAYIDVHVLL
jgi:hypothetical protein